MGVRESMRSTWVESPGGRARAWAYLVAELFGGSLDSFGDRGGFGRHNQSSDKGVWWVGREEGEIALR